MENQLQVLVRESGLEQSKAQVLLERFQDYFQIAAEWEAKAKTIKVTDAKQQADMQMARVGRLFLREKRIAIENTRKELKEQSLREGKAIDGLANVLKAVIVPIEEYLDQQEHFVEIEAKKKAEIERIEAEKKAEEERIAEEKRIAAEQERIRLDNIRLQKEVEERERKIREQQEQAEADRRKQEAILAKQKADAEAKQKAIEDKARIEREQAEAERKRLEAELASMITCPKCGHKFNK
jgi:hypothetical protein